MYLDYLLAFDPSGTAVTSSAASTNVIDFGVARDMGVGEDPVWLVSQVNTSFTAAGAATLQVQFQTSADNATWVTLVQSDTIAKAALIAGAELLRIALPLGISRYVRLNYVVATGPFTAGALQSFITPDRQANIGYAEGSNVGYV